jgi:hypothetical protein
VLSCSCDAVQKTFDVDVDHLVPILDVQVVEGRTGHDAGIVDEKRDEALACKKRQQRLVELRWRLERCPMLRARNGNELRPGHATMCRLGDDSKERPSQLSGRDRHGNLELR